MFPFDTSYYYIIIGLQAICAIHCMRKGNQNKWIWLIVFLPLIGSIAYIFTEIFTKREMGQIQSGAGAIFNPSGNIKKLQNNLKFRDTFDNRIALADAYLAVGQYDSAIELYENSLVGTFSEHEHGCMQLIIAYFEKRRYDDLTKIAKNVYRFPQFARSRAHMLYAIALGYTNQEEAAEKEFSFMKGKFSNYECRYYYAKFLNSNNRINESKQILNEMINEADHLTSNERRMNKEWFKKAKDALKNMNVVNS